MVLMFVFPLSFLGALEIAVPSSKHKTGYIS